MPGLSCSHLRPLSLLHPISYKSPSHHSLTSLEFFHFPLSLLLYLGQTLSSHPDHNYSFLISSLPLHLLFQFIFYTAILVSFLNHRFQQSIPSSKFYCSSPKSSLLTQSSVAQHKRLSIDLTLASHSSPCLTTLIMLIPWYLTNYGPLNILSLPLWTFVYVAPSIWNILPNFYLLN